MTIFMQNLANDQVYGHLGWTCVRETRSTRATEMTYAARERIYLAVIAAPLLVTAANAPPATRATDSRTQR